MCVFSSISIFRHLSHSLGIICVPIHVPHQTMDSGFSSLDMRSVPWLMTSGRPAIWLMHSDGHEEASTQNYVAAGLYMTGPHLYYIFWLSTIDTYNFLNIPGYFMQLSVFKFSNSHIPSLWEEDWQNQAFQVSVHVSFSSPRRSDITLYCPSFQSSRDYINWLNVSPLCSQSIVSFNGPV